MYNAVNHYVKANKKYMEDYDKNEKSSYLQHGDINSLYGWVMFQKLPTYNFEWVEDNSQFNEVFIKNYDEKSEVGYILEVDVQYQEKLYELLSDLPFSPEGKKLGKVEKSVDSLEGKCKYVIHIKSLKQALNHGLVVKNVHKAISFNQDESSKPYIEMNNELRIEAKNYLKDNFSN